MATVTCFGEIMLRLQPANFERFVQASSFEVEYGGGEANVSVSLSNFGVDTAFVSKLPANPIGQAAVNALRRYGVDTRHLVRGGERVGIYFLEKGASQRASKVVYDRAHSSISTAVKKDFDWSAILAGSTWFHFTGITPALGDNVVEIVAEACAAAKKAGCTISCDLNFRKNLWTSAKANAVMGSLMHYVDVCIANEEDAEKVFGIKAQNSNIADGRLNHDGYKAVARELQEKFGFKQVAITLRGSISASDNNWAAMLFDGTDYHFSKSYPIHIIDRVGGGDSFGAGLIYGLINNFSARDALEFAVAASCLKHTIPGDMNMVSVDEVKTLMGGDGSGRVQR